MKKRLGDYIQEYSVRNKLDEDIPVYSVTNSQGFCRDYFSKDVASKDRTTYKIVPRGCFAYNPSRINVGSVDWQRNEERVIVSPLYNVFSVSDKLDQQYLYYYLKSAATLHRIKEVATGSVRDNLRLPMLYDFTIEMPERVEQLEIVKKLDLLSDTIRLRRNQLSEIDNLVKARFVEMFGNPSINSFRFSCEPLGNCLLGIENGKSFVCSNDMRQGENPAILKLSAVTYGVYQQHENKAILDDAMFVKSAEVHIGDLLFTRKNTPELVGMCAYVNDTKPNLMMPDLIFRLNTNEKINKIFLWKLINHELFRSKIQNIATGSAKSMSNISKERLEKLEIILPPRALQNDFAAFVEEVDKSRLLEIFFEKTLAICMKCVQNRSWEV